MMLKAVTLLASALVSFAHDLEDEPEVVETKTLSEAYVGPKRVGFEIFIDSGRLEFYALMALIAAFGFLCYGILENNRLAERWFDAMNNFLYANFSRIGHKENVKFIKEGYDHFWVYASGRKNILGAVLNLNLAPRQDIVSQVLGFATGGIGNDTMTLEVFLPASAPAGCFAITKQGAKTNIKDAERDLELLTVDAPTAPTTALFRSKLIKDSFDGVDKIGLAKFAQKVVDAGHGSNFISLTFSDQAHVMSPGGPAVIPLVPDDPSAAPNLVAMLNGRTDEEIKKDLADKPAEEIAMRKPFVGVRNLPGEPAIGNPGEVARVARLTIAVPSTPNDSLWSTLANVAHEFLLVVDQFVEYKGQSEKSKEAVRKERIEGYKKAAGKTKEDEEEEKNKLIKQREEEKLAKMTPAERKKYLEKKEKKASKPKLPTGGKMKIMK